VVGLGDRHLNNILIDKTTAELVHIDLGMIFEYSKRVLPIPERVPFRLTRDIVDPILVEGVNGRFKHVAIHALEQLQQNAQVIVGIASLLLHDPISTFAAAKIVDTDKPRNMFAETAISRLSSKLEGRDLSYVGQTPEQQVLFLLLELKTLSRSLN
jgi:ataxia telangiectasia mutated family protein